jgi:hypothetical protein
MINIVRILKEELGPQAYNVPLRKAPDFLLKLKPYLVASQRCPVSSGTARQIIQGVAVRVITPFHSIVN